MSKKLCEWCGKEFEPAKFHPEQKFCGNSCGHKKRYEENKDKPEFKEKRKASGKKYRKENKEKIREKGKKYYKENKDKPEVKEKRKVYEKEYRSRLEVKERRKNKKTKKKCAIWGKKYYQKNKFKINARNRRNKQKPENRTKVREDWRKRYNEDTPWRIKENLRSRLQGALRLYSKTGKIMTAKSYGINYKKIIEYLKPFPKDIENYDVDHIIPLSWFDFNNPEEIKWAFVPENHQWLTKEENGSKGNRFMG